MERKCPCCGELLEQLSDNELYCKKDDLTISLVKGRLEFKSDKKGKVQELEETIAELQMTVNTMKEKLFGTEDVDLW